MILALPLFLLGKQVMNNYPRSSVPNSQKNQQQPWLQPQPFTHQQQQELITGISGMSITSIARVTGDMIENGGELGVVPNSPPAMSPNLHMTEGHTYLEVRNKIICL